MILFLFCHAAAHMNFTVQAQNEGHISYKKYSLHDFYIAIHLMFCTAEIIIEGLDGGGGGVSGIL